MLKFNSMKINKTEKILRLLLFLGKHPLCMKSLILKELDCDERTFYNYLHDLREVGFIVKCKSGHYTIAKNNEAAKCFNQLMNTNSEDTLIIHSAINKLNINENKKAEILSHFALNINNSELVNNTPIIKKTIHCQENRNQAIIKKHKSNLSIPKSFICEIYFHDDKQIHCWMYVPTENKNYKIKIEDIISISISPIQWMFSTKHLKIEKDIFGSYGVKNKTIIISLDAQGAKMLIENTPSSKIFIKNEENSNIYSFVYVACDYLPICSFILIKMQHIIEINGLELNLYIKNWIEKISLKFDEKYLSQLNLLQKN